MKWTVIGKNIIQKRYEVLRDFLTNQKIENEMVLQNCEDGEFEAVLQKSMQEFQQIRIDSPYRSKVLECFTTQSMMTASLGAADTLIFEQGQWWPKSVLFQSFNQLYTRYGSVMDIAGTLLVVGSGASSRLAVASAVRAGFSKIIISTAYHDLGRAFVDEMKRRYFGVDFQFVPHDMLVMLPGNSSLLINTTPLVEGNDILAELYYLNFLRPDGIIWDMIILPATTPLIREGEHINIKSIRGREVAALADIQWLDWVLPGKIQPLSLEEYYVQQFTDPSPAETHPSPDKITP